MTNLPARNDNRFAFILLAVIFKMISLPNFRQEGKVEAGVKVFKHKHFVWGWLAIVLIGYAYLVYFGFYGARADDQTADSARSVGAGN